MKKISIIIPVYNAVDYLDTCVNNLLNQTFDNLEFIFIDDGSTDASLKKLKEYKKKDERIKLFHQKNKGVSVARNKGLKLATGDYIGFVDSDDLIDKTMYERLLNVMTQKKSDITCCKYVKFTDKYEFKLNGDVTTYSREDAIKEILEENEISNFLWDKLFKRELFDGIKFKENKIFEDLDVVYRLIDQANKVSVVDEVLYAYYQRSDSCVHKFKESYITNYIEVYRERINFLKEKYPHLDKEINKVTIVSIFILFRMIVLANRPDLLTDSNVIKEYQELLKLKKDVRYSLRGIKKILAYTLIINKNVFYYIASILYKVRRG